MLTGKFTRTPSMDRAKEGLPVDACDSGPESPMRVNYK